MTSVQQERRSPQSPPPTRQIQPAAFDVLRVPLLGQFLKWRYSRTALQVPVLVLSVVMVVHAFWGPQLAPKNLAALLTWVHFRGLVVLVLLLAGNLFCMACPFMLPRELARRWFTPRWEWPTVLRNKWPAIALFVMVLFIYELFDLWSDPWMTGVMIVGYFAAAIVVDSLFRRASFCKYVCPVGQFNFLGSTLSPLEVAVRDQTVCTSCTTKDCIRGRRAERPQVEASSAIGSFTTHFDAEPGATAGLPSSAVPRILTAGQASSGTQRGFETTSSNSYSLPVIQRGCELALFQPRKVGNLDCTFCLDCVYACPHDNVGILSRLPAERLAISGTRSGIGKIEKRFDFTVLATVFTFGALLNAFAMISPVYALEQWVAEVTGLRVEWPILVGMFGIALVLEPALLLGAAAAVSRLGSGAGEPLLSVVNRYARSLVPLGFGIWLAHYGFHFFTGFLTVIPVAQNAAERAFGMALLGVPMWQLGGIPEWIVYPMEIGFMSLGLLGSWLVAWYIADEHSPRRVWSSFSPWAVLHFLLYVSAMWIMTQPMDMRGTFLGG